MAQVDLSKLCIITRGNAAGTLVQIERDLGWLHHPDHGCPVLTAGVLVIGHTRFATAMGNLDRAALPVDWLAPMEMREGVDQMLVIAGLPPGEGDYR